MTTTEAPAPSASVIARRLVSLHGLTRLVLFAGFWLVFAGNDPQSWIIGAPAVLLASWTAERLSRRRGRDVTLGGLLRYIPFFLWESILGGTDVAKRVMRPEVDIAPGLIEYKIRLTEPGARVFFLDSISLLPGTLSADYRDGIAYVHALDADEDLLDPLRRLELRVADLFGERLGGEPDA
ncbi:MAG: Na+/H+ antiporter subunit E [Thiohalocapsa sp.]|jgi:multicomponent Na+:H+ antiporter subunit E|nr:Na+/H+ antiporter subunit E [Thiohalocapsa sp.]MCF7991184.1 Na+/H+ antiporter subunit E [Thiohalocapsa sp.]